MSNWAENIAKNAAAARDCCADKLGAVSRLVSSSFDDLRHGNWHFYQNDHPYDHIENAMVWAEALVRRVILSLVTEIRRETKHSVLLADPSEGWDPSRALEARAEGEEALPTVIPHLHSSIPCPSACGMTTESQPPRPYRPTFQWSELRPAPTIPTGKINTAPRPKPRKHDFKTKVEARLTLFAHMLEHKEAYAKRLAFRLDARSNQTRSTVIPERGKAAVTGTQNEENKGGVSEAAALSVTHREASDLVRDEASGQTKDQFPKLAWSLYTTDPPPIAALRDDLVALHMAYEQP